MDQVFHQIYSAETSSKFYFQVFKSCDHWSDENLFKILGLDEARSSQEKIQVDSFLSAVVLPKLATCLDEFKSERVI